MVKLRGMIQKGSCLIVGYDQYKASFFVAFCEWTSEKSVGIVVCAALQTKAGRRKYL